MIKHNLSDIFSLMHLLCFVHKLMIKYCKTCIKIINMKPCWKLIFNKFCSKLVAFACDQIRLATFLLLRFNVFKQNIFLKHICKYFWDALITRKLSLQSYILLSVWSSYLIEKNYFFEFSIEIFIEAINMRSILKITKAWYYILRVLRLNER